MVKYVFYCSSINYWSKKPVTHTNISHWLCNIPSDLQLAVGLSIILVVHKNHVNMRLLVRTMVKYVFHCTSIIDYWSKKPVTHTNLNHWLYNHSQWPSISFWLSIILVVHKNHVKMRLLVNTMVKCSSINYWSKNLPSKQTLAIGYTKTFPVTFSLIWDWASFWLFTKAMSKYGC